MIYVEYTTAQTIIFCFEFQALEKYKYEQSLEHTSEFIEKLEKELDKYYKHKARFAKEKERSPKD